jgi:hypothetical protein
MNAKLAISKAAKTVDALCASNALIVPNINATAVPRIRVNPKVVFLRVRLPRKALKIIQIKIEV